MSADMKPPPTVTQTITLRNKDKSNNGNNGGTNTAINDKNYKEHSTGYNSSNIKSSFSMTSLPPNEVHDGSVKAKLTMERPYNSLKKKRNSDGDSWRHSWGSGQSHSSCSLHSNATGATGLGKDEFWAALQSNYNYIMDTNLLDTCKEARGEIEGTSNIIGNAPECCRSQLKHQEEERDKNPRALRKWLREMENKLSNTPSLHQATQLSCSELQERLAQHSVLYYEIVSHARVVGACIKAFDKENNCSNDNSFNSLSSEDCPPSKGRTTNENNITITTTSPNTNNNNNKKCDGSLKALERRYHLLYLKAIEVQCLFEGLIKRKDCTGILSEVTTSNEESESTDNEPVSKLAKLSNFDHSSGPTAFELFGFTNSNQEKENLNQDNTLVPDDDKNYSINQYDENINDTVVDEVDNSHQEEIKNWQKQNFNKSIDIFYNTYSDFDADSEGSDYDELNKNLKYRQKRFSSGNNNNNNKNKCNLQKGLHKSNTIINDYNVFNISEIMDTSSNNIITSSTSLPLLQKNSVINEKLSLSSENKLNIVINQSLNRSSKSIIENSNNSSGNFENSSSPSSPILRVSTPISSVNKKQQQQRRNFDVSKFNRSNRKSKNCAIFYFKHLDTDNETNFGISSQGSEAIQSVDDDEIDEEDDDDDWMYTSNEHLESKSINEITVANDSSDLVGNLLSDDSDKENKKIILVEQKSNNMDRNHKDANGNIQFQENDRPSAALIRSPSITQNCNKKLVDDCIKQSQKNIDPFDIKSNNDKIPFEEISQIATTEINATAMKTNVAATISDEMPPKTNKEEVCHDSIKQLVLDAENLVRDEILKTPKKKNHSGGMKISTTIKKRDIMLPGHNIQRVHEWLEHQPLSPKKCTTAESKSIPTTDCEASGEYTESDSAPARESDSSDGFTDSIATCMQTGGSTSQCTSTEIIGDLSGEQSQMPYIGSNPSLSSGKVIRRIPNRRNSERPWSVSCLSQLTEINVGDSSGICCDQIKASPTKNILASHSISESAINILSSPLRCGSKQSPQTPVKNSDSKSSLKRRKTRKKKLSGRKTDSGSEKLNNYDLPTLTQTLMNSETISTEQITIIQDLAAALSMLSLPQQQKTKSEMESEEDSQQQQQLMKPNFKVGGTYTKSNLNESKLGSLAALANYMNEDGECQAGTDDHNSSFSEQAWDNYQEKYNSENYSEGFDSDAARRLMEFGDDYRNFLDSQSDCCSSLSAANNLDSLSPPRMDSLQQSEVKFTQETIASTVDHARRRRALEIEYERRRKTLEMKRKASQEQIQQNAILSSATNSVKVNSTSLTPKSNDNRSLNRAAIDSVSRKLDFNNSSNCVKRSSESETSIRRRKQGDSEQSGVRRRCPQSYKGIPSTSSSSNEDSENEEEINNMLLQSRNRLENTNALKIRTHLLRPEDYTEIINTCRDNITCLDAVLRGPSRTALSSNQSTEIRDLLSNWEILLGWSENAGAARKMQEEMIILKNSINRLGCKISTNMESVESIQFIIDELKNEKIELQKYRTNMLRLNASVHSWLTRHENKLHKELEALQVIDDNNDNDGDGNKQNESGGVEPGLCEKALQINSIVHSESEFHKHLKNEVSEMYRAWEEADSRINYQLDALTASLIAWRQLDYGLSEFYQVLGNDRGTLEGLEGALEKNPTKSMELSHNVKLVAKLLSEKIEGTHQHQQITGIHSTSTEEPNHLDVQKFIHITRIAASNGSLSDSGISDGGTTSDGGLSERERRLGVLRRLAKQLETALAPGSEALQSITARMEAAEAELKTLQNTCRDLIVRTAISQQTKLIESTNKKIEVNSELAEKSPNRLKKKNSPQLTKRKNKRRTSIPKIPNETSVVAASNRSLPKGKTVKFTNSDELDYGNYRKTKSSSWDDVDSDNTDIEPQRSWTWRVARIAVPMQLALFTIFCAACLMEPHCCSSINNLAMSFTPQLRYIRGPPPI